MNELKAILKDIAKTGGIKFLIFLNICLFLGLSFCFCVLLYKDFLIVVYVGIILGLIFVVGKFIRILEDLGD
jgi:hypothetical protein